MRLLEPLGADHDRESFDCGVVALNHYLQQVAKQHSKRGISRVFVLVDANAAPPKTVLGFFSLAACEAESEVLPEAVARRLPRKIPAVRLGRLAVHQEYQGQGIGTDLVLLALKKTAEGASTIGIAGLFVDAKDAHVAQFYEKFGFVALPDQPLTLFLPVQSLLQTVTAMGF